MAGPGSSKIPWVACAAAPANATNLQSFDSVLCMTRVCARSYERKASRTYNIMTVTKRKTAPLADCMHNME